MTLGITYHLLKYNKVSDNELCSFIALKICQYDLVKNLKKFL